MQLGRHMGKLLFSVCVQVFHGGSFTKGPVCDLHNSHFFFVVHTCLLCVWKEAGGGDSLLSAGFFWVCTTGSLVTLLRTKSDFSVSRSYYCE